jgi:hypothetical protein
MEPLAKGVAFRGLIGALERLHGEPAVTRLVELLPATLANAVRFGKFVSGGWYPLSDYRLLHATAARAVGAGPGLSRAIGREATLDDFRGVYRVLTFVLSPEFLIRRSPALWNRYFSVGRLKIPEAKQGAARAEFTGCVGFDYNLWDGALGGCIGVLESCGARDVQITIVGGGSDHDDHLTANATWR